MLSPAILTSSRQILNPVKSISNSGCCNKYFQRNLLMSLKQRQTRHVPKEIKRPPYILGSTDIKQHFPEIKTKQQIEEIRPACTLAAEVLRHVGEVIQVGMTTDDIDAVVHQRAIAAGAYPSPLGYQGFPKSCCTSVNKVACHGVPGPEELREGDVLNVDVTLYLNGYHGDTSAMFCVGDIDDRAELLVQAARECRDAGISVCRDGAPFSQIGEIIAETAREYGFNVIPEFCGHGIGKYFHGPPSIVHTPTGIGEEGEMKTGMTFTIEPIIIEGHPFFKILEDNWTALANSRSAQWEHTILITDNGCEILTK